MADVWVLHRTSVSGQSVRSQLIRADAIHCLQADEHTVRTADPLAQRVELANSENSNHGLPFDFHLALLAEIARARKSARDGEDQVVAAERDAFDQWAWKTYRVSELG